MEQTTNKQVIIQNWGSINYIDAWHRQEQLFNEIIREKMNRRNRSLNPGFVQSDQTGSSQSANYLVFCEHPHVYTLGKSGNPDHLLLDEQTMQSKGIRMHRANRGGDITYHGPGQLVCYPILDLENFTTDIHLYLRNLENAVLLTLNDYNLTAGLEPGHTGVWFDPSTAHARKVAAMGVRCSRWVTMHGLSLNVNPDLGYFQHIIACGLEGKAVTSMQSEAGQTLNVQEVQARLQHHIGEIFGMTFSAEG